MRYPFLRYTSVFTGGERKVREGKIKMMRQALQPSMSLRCPLRGTPSCIFTRGFHCTRPPFRVRTSSSSKSSVREEAATPEVLSDDDIKQINSLFLARTHGLEPDVELKELPVIKQEFYDRYKQRYYSPSRFWMIQNKMKLASDDKFIINAPQLLKKHNNEASLSDLVGGDSSLQKTISGDKFEFDPIEMLRTSLKVGDMVLLRNYEDQLMMCIDLPKSTSDPRYTFASIKGNLIFRTKNSVVLRIPNPEIAKLKLRNLILRETNHGYAPIGIPMTHTKLATAAGTHSEIGSTDTLVLPVVARQLVTSQAPSRITEASSSQLPIVIKKLKLLHRLLQNPNGPYQIPFIKLVQLVQNVDLTKFYSMDTVDVSEPQQLLSFFQGDSLGSKGNIKASTFLATYWALREHQKFNMWGNIYTNRSANTPIAVTVLPFTSSVSSSSLLQSFTETQIDKIARVLNNLDTDAVDKTNFGENRIFYKLATLLRNYIAGNYPNNDRVIITISNIIRRIDRYRDMDITKELCFELLQLISPQNRDQQAEQSLTLANPLLLSHDLNLPFCSQLTKHTQLLYQLSQPPSTEPGPRVSTRDEIKRTYFTHLNVYCIDSPDAHEIDDGISIESLGKNRYTIYVHIADPASFFINTPASSSSSASTSVPVLANSDILKVALTKSFTTYLPDIVDPMLPPSYCRRADMGQDGKMTKTVSFSVNVKVIDDSRLEVEHDTFKIRLGYVSRFPKVDYSKVDEILEQKRPTSPALTATEKVTAELHDLYMLASLLRDRRVQDHNAVLFGDEFNRGLVKLVGENSGGKLPQITFYDNTESKSSILVSEMMILANSLAGKFFKEHNIPGIYRCYNNLELGRKAASELEFLQKRTKSGFMLSMRDVTRLNMLLNSSFYSSTPLKHSMIGTDQYLTVTSPLRRFPDLVNHLQIHQFISGGKPYFTPTEIDEMLPHIQTRADILKTSARQVNAYWTLSYLRQVISDEPDKNTFDVMVNSVPMDGKVYCSIPSFSFARGSLKLRKDQPVPLIGSTVKGCKISKILPLDGILELVV